MKSFDPSEADHNAHAVPHTLPGEPHNRDMANPGELWAYLLAAVIVAALAIGYGLSGLAGVGAVMIGLVPIVFVALLMITVGR